MCRWRLDKSCNRTSYTRQLDSLVKLCSPHGTVLAPKPRGQKGQKGQKGKGASVQAARPRVFDLITIGEVGSVDEWVKVATCPSWCTHG